MNKHILSIFFLFTVFFISCNSEEKQKGKIVAQVNNARITNSDLNMSVPSSMPDEVKKAFKRELMEKWIEEEIFYQAAIDEGLELSESELTMVQNYRRKIIVQKYLDKYANRIYKILDQEVEDYYNKHANEFLWNSDYVHIIHLVMESDDRAINREIRNSKQLLDVINKNFFDQQSTRERPNGDLGYVKLSDLPGSITRAISTMKTGTIRGPIKSEYGIHYIQLLDIQRLGSQKEFDLVKDEIIMRLKLQKRNSEIENLKNKLRPDFTIQTDLSNIE